MEDDKKLSTKLAIVGWSVIVLIAGAAAGVTYGITRNYYLGAISKMNQTASDAGVLDTLIAHQNSH